MRLFFLSTIGTRLRDARLAKSMTQGDLASAIGTSQQAVASMEKKSPAASKYFMKICEVLDIEYEWLVKGEKPAPGNSKSDNVDAYIDAAIDALEESLRAVKLASLRRGDESGNIDQNLLREAFKISVRGKMTGDYLTAALSDKLLKKA